MNLNKLQTLRGETRMTKEEVEAKIKEILNKDPRYKDAKIEITLSKKKKSKSKV